MEIKKFIREHQVAVAAALATTGILVLAYIYKDSEAVSLAKQANRLKSMEHSFELEKLSCQVQVAALESVEKLSEGDKASFLTAIALNKVARNFGGVESALEEVLDRVESLQYSVDRLAK